jgi:predicted nucleotidyltransferase
MIYVVVTWMDRTQETYRCDSSKIDNGVLYLTPYSHDVDMLYRKIPLFNVKIFTEEHR